MIDRAPSTSDEPAPNLADLRRLLAGVPDAQPVDDLAAPIADSVAYLGSDAAIHSIARDTYWPKWHSPWWHMLALHELGEARQIPARAVTAMVHGLDALPVKVFPVRPEDAPGAELWRDSTCHCAVGSMYQVLTACGVDVDAALPWIRPWFSRYQMTDGGLSCDDTAYLVDHECPSSMVGTIAPFEAMLVAPPGADRDAFLARAAGFLIGRELRLGSPTAHNAEERSAAASWLAPCFPRLYFYDVLRGLAALVRWAELADQPVPARTVARVAAHLATAFPDGVIRLQRHGFASCPTSRSYADGSAGARVPTTTFPLLDAASAIGKPCAASTRQWAAARRGLLALLDAGRVTP